MITSLNCYNEINHEVIKVHKSFKKSFYLLLNSGRTWLFFVTSVENNFFLGLGPKQHPKRLKLDKSPGTSDPLKNCPGISEPLQNSPGISEPLENRFQEIEIKLGEDIKPVNR